MLFFSNPFVLSISPHLKKPCGVFGGFEAGEDGK